MTVASPEQSARSQVLNTSSPATPEWFWGRRLVELIHLAMQLLCVDCGQTLSLHEIFTERRYVLASFLYINCECVLFNKVSTNKTAQTSHHGPPAFDVNTKAAIGMFLVLNCKNALFQI